jgi:hypothetical protein
MNLYPIIPVIFNKSPLKDDLTPGIIRSFISFGKKPVYFGGLKVFLKKYYFFILN